MKKFLTIIAFALPLIFLDQVVKFYALTGKLEGEIIPHFFSFTLKMNEGIALSLPIEGWFQIALIFLILIFGGFYVRKYLNLKNTVNQWIVASILGGAVGNLIDRFWRGAVVDFIAIWHFPVFNLADVFIFYGVCLLFYFELTEKRKIT